MANSQRRSDRKGQLVNLNSWREQSFSYEEGGLREQGVDTAARRHPNQAKIWKRAKAMTCGFCSYCFWRRAKEVHHFYYLDEKGRSIVGFEEPGIDVVPLCKKCHGLSHRKENWYEAFDDPTWNNHNYRFWIWELRIRFAIFSAVLWIAPVLVPMLLVLVTVLIFIAFF